MPDSRRGALSIVAAAFLFALMGAAIKSASSPDVSTWTVVFIRNAVGLALVGPWMIGVKKISIATPHWRDHLVRSLAGVVSMFCSFYAIANMPLADAILLSYTGPLFMPCIARWWLGEDIPKGVWQVLALGFGGVLVILRPGSDLFSPVSLIAVAAGVLGAVAQVAIRSLGRTEPGSRIVFYFALVGTLFAAAPLPAVWQPMSLTVWAALLVAGLMATLGQMFLTRGYLLAPPAVVGPFIYAAVVFAGLLDWILWDRAPDILFLAGAGMIVYSGALAMSRMKVRPAAGAVAPE